MPGLSTFLRVFLSCSALVPTIAQADGGVPTEITGYSSVSGGEGETIGQSTLDVVPDAEPASPWSDIADSAEPAATRLLSARAVDAAWSGGLSAWRAGDYAGAATRFEAVAASDRASAWTTAGAAFWAARSLLFDRRPDEASRWLALAAGSGETFYGLLARRILGLPMGFRWELTDEDRAAEAVAEASAEGQTALAAVEAGDFGRAERSLRSLAGSGDTQAAHGAMVIAERSGLAELAFRLQRQLAPYGIDFPPAAYPLPNWRPEGGFSTDRALIFALMRQESCFDPRAVSPAGARGLMQLMPATARFVARTTGFPATSARLGQPEVNIALGQRYLQLLLADDAVGEDLFLLAAAWNGGPGNLERWRRDPEAYDDPLLFIETIPFAETRGFIEHVLANLWIYRDRLGRPSPSLDALAAGDWPSWDGAAPEPVELAEHEQN